MTPAPRPAPSRPRPCPPRRGFTLIELMVVIGIIVLLAAILLPVVSKVRQTGYDTSTQQQMQRIMQACQQYYHDFNSYPGPVANVNLSGGSSPVAPGTGILNVTANNGATGITSSENLVLGLLGYLDPPTAGASPAAPKYNQIAMPPGPPPHDVLSLNPLRPAKYTYLDYTPSELSPGSAGSLEALTGLMIADTNVPEFVDRFPSPMPILYIRANVGAIGTPQANNGDFVTVGGVQQFVQYNYAELAAYGCNVLMTDGSIKSWMLDNTYFTKVNGTNPSIAADFQRPFMDWNGVTQIPSSSPAAYDGYLTNPYVGGGGTAGGTVRGKDGFILISTGKDRVYGTHDDTIVTP